MNSLQLITHKIGASQTDTEEEKLRKAALVFISLLIALAGLAWGFMYLLLGLFETASIPFFYSLTVGVCLIGFHYKKNYFFLAYTQLMLILFLPFFVQLSLGGILSSGFVMIWGILAPIGSVIFLDPRKSIFWFVGYLICTIVFIYFDKQIALHFKKQMSLWVPEMFLSLNIIVSSTITFVSILYYLNGKISEEKKSSELLRQAQAAKEEIGEKNDLLEKSLKERDILLKEIHHRVKNNLQVITSLLSLQANYISDEKVKALLRYSQYRIQSMAIIHEMLYRSKDLSKIAYARYIESLVKHLVSSMKGSENNVEIEIDAPDVYFNIDTAIPLGLMINEIITNALKYGLPGNANGKVTIRIQKNKNPHYTLFIGDDGVGFPEQVNFRESTSLGILLMHNLALQLKGSIEKTKEKGTHYIVTFQEIIQTS